MTLPPCRPASGLTLLAFLSCAVPTVASAEALLCLGTSPAFMMVLDGDRATLDYLGDGQYQLDPPLPAGAPVSVDLELVTGSGRWPVRIETRECRVARFTLPIRIELDLPASAGLLPLRACCKISDSARLD